MATGVQGLAVQWQIDMFLDAGPAEGKRQLGTAAIGQHWMQEIGGWNHRTADEAKELPLQNLLHGDVREDVGMAHGILFLLVHEGVE